MLVHAEANLDKRTPLRPLGFPNKMKTGFLRCAVSFQGIAIDARADNIFPRGRSTSIARNHVVQIQIFPFKSFAAILASILITLKNVVPGKLNLLLRHVIVNH